ncbi:sensor histidine kinase [Actinomadura sp. 6N118]|uniref:sensor histidine kinase n=1 Tax=Actinomadura sp. 6N118 TaxID=3375151 RepID=UPI0037929E4F
MAADRSVPGPRRVAAAFGTVRVRLTLAAVLIVGTVLAAAGLILVNVLSTTLTGEVRTATRVRATEIAAQLTAGQRSPALTVTDGEEELIQILDEDGVVISASANVAGRPAVAKFRGGESGGIGKPLDEDPFIAVAVAADTPDGRVTVIVGRALADVLEPTAIVSRSLAVGLPVLLGLIALLIWTMVGRALAPVEAVRREVDEISAAELHRRVPQPPGSDEISRLAATMNRMLGRLDRAAVAQRRFVSDASHELRSPVASIRQHAEVALAHPGHATLDDLATTVLIENARVQRLIDDLLVLARADEQTLLLRRAPVDLDDLVFDEARRLRSGTAGLRIDTTRVSAGRTSGDADALRRVLHNLGDNAARHASRCVAFSLAERNGAALLTVDDDGPGIPVDERERVFERFVRLDKARAGLPEGGGSGLGLAIVAELVRAHGGTVAASSSGLGGARITVTLPVSD